MALVEKVCYEIGCGLVDIVMLGTAPTTFLIGIKCVQKLDGVAKAHALTSRTREAITENVFKCLEYID